MAVTSQMLKAVVISYFRFKRQYCAIDEVSSDMGNADVLCDNGKQIIEVEIKVTRSDLIMGERKKGRHPIGAPKEYGNTPNRFFICVPLELKEVAEKWIEETNPLYGLICFDEKSVHIFKEVSFVAWGNYLWICRSAKKIHGEYKENLFRSICMRASSTRCADIGSRIIL